MNFGPWKTATIAQNATLSDEIDLGSVYENLLVILPTIDSAATNPHVSNEAGGTFVPLHILNDNATGSFLHADTAGTGVIAIIFRIGAVQHIKISVDAAQSTAAVSIPVRGFS